MESVTAFKSILTYTWSLLISDVRLFIKISQGGETVGKIEFITRIQVNGVKEEVSGAKASEIIRERVENALQAMNYEKRAAG